MNILKRELRANLRSLIVWSVIVVLFIAVGVGKFSAYYNNPDMVRLLDSLPKVALDALSVHAFNLTTVSGFFGIMFTYFALLFGIAAAMWGTDIITKEQRDKTVEFALTLPVTRVRLVTAKALASLANCLALLLVAWAVSLLSASRYQPDAAFFKFLALCMLALFIIQLIFLSVGLLLGCALKRYRLAGSAAVSLLLVSYLLSIVTALNKDLDFLKYLSPFKYFDPAVILHQSRFDMITMAISLGIIAVSLTGAYVSYSRRDLYI
jgi:ABC-2 type transport system permease protein